MSDRKQVAFEDSIHNQFMKTEGKTATNKMIHLLGVNNKTISRMETIDRKIDNLQDSVDEIKKLLEGVIR